MSDTSKTRVPSILEIRQKVIQLLGYRPCLWQIRVVEALLKHDKDIISIAATGSGKTLTFWMPLLFRPDGIQIIITPLNILGKKSFSCSSEVWSAPKCHPFFTLAKSLISFAYFFFMTVFAQSKADPEALGCLRKALNISVELWTRSSEQGCSWKPASVSSETRNLEAVTLWVWKQCIIASSCWSIASSKTRAQRSEVDRIYQSALNVCGAFVYLCFLPAVAERLKGRSWMGHVICQLFIIFSD